MSHTLNRWTTETGYTVRIVHDEDCENPRDNDGHFVWLGFPHRRYTIGDTTIDPERLELPCNVCDGTDADCTTCYGDNVRSVRSLADLIAWVTAEYDARLVVPVGMLDHSGVSYYLGGGPHWSDSAGWDSGTCGVMVATNAALAEWGIPDATDDELRRQMTAELDEYTRWANGDCWGYVITDVNGDEVDSCWGFIGSDSAETEARAACPTEPVEPEYVVRLTKAEIQTISGALLDGGDPAEAPLAARLLAALPLVRSSPPACGSGVSGGRGGPRSDYDYVVEAERIGPPETQLRRVRIPAKSADYQADRYRSGMYYATEVTS